MKPRKLMYVAVLTLFAAVPTASASKWYVDGKHGNDNNDCKSRQHACRTISNALSLTLPGDFIFVAPATYHEGLYIPFNLKIFGSGAKTTIIDGGGISQVAIVGSEPKVPVTLSRMILAAAIEARMNVRKTSLRQAKPANLFAFSCISRPVSGVVLRMTS